MSTRRSTPGLLVVLAAAGLAACGGALAISACSSSTDTPAGSDAGDAATDSRKVVEGDDAAPDAGAEAGSCADTCAALHPTAVAKDDAIGTCWDDNKCTPICVDGYDGGFDGGDGGLADGGALCGTDVPSVNDACDQCTEAYCCTSWKGCFGDPECSAYEDCLGNCP
jgi:hypothetical protein